MKPVVSVLVVNYNGQSFLAQLLASLALAFERHASEIIVVDNASTDGSRQWLRSRSGFELIELDANVGFAAGNNVAAAVARGEVLLLINNDTAVSQSMDALVDAALAEGVGAVGCQLRYGDGSLQHSIGLAHTPLRIALSWLGWERKRGAPPLFRKVETKSQVYAQPQRDVAWVSGACLATRAEVWRAVGGFDEELFMYCEDVDYAQRVRARGWRIGYTPAPVVIHFEGAGKPWPGALALLRTVRAYFLLITKTTGRRTARLLSLWLGALFGARGLAFSLLGVSGRKPRVELARDKARGYRRASASMLRAAWSGQAPLLP